MIRYAEKLQIVPVWAPQVSTVADSETTHIKLKNVQHLSFLVQYGAMATDTSDSGTILLYSSTAASTAGAVAQTFKYRLCEAVGGDTWGAITTATAAGVTVANTDDNKALLIDVDPSEILKLDSNANFVHLLIDCSLMTGVYLSAAAIIEPRYPQNDNLSTT